MKERGFLIGLWLCTVLNVGLVVVNLRRDNEIYARREHYIKHLEAQLELLEGESLIDTLTATVAPEALADSVYSSLPDSLRELLEAMYGPRSEWALLKINPGEHGVLLDSGVIRIDPYKKDSVTANDGWK